MASVFPKPNMDYIGKVLSELLSDQLGEEIVFRFVPKEGEKGRTKMEKRN
jgi:hypothetical protein